MREKAKDKGRLEHILAAIERVERFMDGKTYDDLRQNEEKQKDLVHQLTNLALLANGLLKGEALSKFLKRSVEMI